MKEFSYTIKDSLGIHARPAGQLVKEAGKFNSDIKIKKADKEIDIKKIIALMGLGVKRNETVTITVSGDDEEEAFKTLQEFFKNTL